MPDEETNTPIIKEATINKETPDTLIPLLPEGLTVDKARYLSRINRLELQLVGAHYSVNDYAYKKAYIALINDFISNPPESINDDEKSED